jgi:hypothetical protein
VQLRAGLAAAPDSTVTRITGILLISGHRMSIKQGPRPRLLGLGRAWRHGMLICFARLSRHPEYLLLVALVGNIAFYISLASTFA